MADQDFSTRIKRTGKRVLKIIIISLIVVGGGVFAYMYWGEVESGTMAGKILRVSEKGYVFKTYEAKINLETFGALRNASPIAEAFDFSVEKSNKDLIKRLEEVALRGERVNLHYIKRPAHFFWRGDTRYFATSIDRLEATPPQ